MADSRFVSCSVQRSGIGSVSVWRISCLPSSLNPQPWCFRLSAYTPVGVEVASRELRPDSHSVAVNAEPSLQSSTSQHPPATPFIAALLGADSAAILRSTPTRVVSAVAPISAAPIARAVCFRSQPLAVIPPSPGAVPARHSRPCRSRNLNLFSTVGARQAAAMQKLEAPRAVPLNGAPCINTEL